MKNTKFLGLAAGAITLGSIFAACQPKPLPTPDVQNTTNTETTDTTTDAPKEQSSIIISQYTYAPDSLTVSAGSTVRVSNKDGVGHTVSSDDGSSFETGIVNQGATVEFTAPTKPGTYTYHCTPHPQMKGTLIVE